MKFFLFLLLSLLLLETYKDQNISGLVMSEKLDGIRAYWDGKKLISRGGKIIHAPKYFTKEFPPFEIDGELWTKRSDFNHISSIVRDKTPSKEWKQISYNIFEVPNAAGGLFARLEKVKPYENKIIRIIPQIPVKSKGKFKNTMGALKCQLENGKIFKLGGGFNNQERENPPKIGSVVTFKYKEFTKNGMPRFPVFMRVRCIKN
jgi:DNA ligase-1